MIGRTRSERMVGNAVEYVGRTPVGAGDLPALLEAVEMAERAMASGLVRVALSHAFVASEQLLAMSRGQQAPSEEMRQASVRAKDVIFRVLQEC